MGSKDGNEWKDVWGLEDTDYKQPIDPPKVIYHGSYGRSGTAIPEEFRRVFGTPPAKEAKKPVPPPPFPPNTYHKKPKYWQSRSTGHMAITNRIAGFMVVFFGVVAYGLNRFSDAPKRWQRRFGNDMTDQQRVDYHKNVEFHASLMNEKELPIWGLERDPNTWEYRNPRRRDDYVRWDLREVDNTIKYHKDFANPMDDPL